jgi:hypothetical protein
MAGSVGRAAQQLLHCMLAPLSAIPAQQSCAALCAGCRHVSAGAAKAPINTMATAARWKTPCNMLSAYNSAQFLR